VVFGRRAGLAAPTEAPLEAELEPPQEPPLDGDRIDGELREQMWREAGLVRDAAGLEQLLTAPALVPRLVAECALARCESRGVHFRADFPIEDPELAAHTVLRDGQSPVFERWS